jgi:hypothetical protein
VAYTRPDHDAGNATWQGKPVYTRPAHDEADATWLVAVPGSDSSPLGQPAFRVVQVTAARLAALSPLFSPAARTLNAQVASPLAAPALRVTVHRYILAGNVIYGGLAVERLVRAYRRDTGQLIGSANTNNGAFVINAGFAPSEHYLLPVDTSPEATDFNPPTANRVLSVLTLD